MFGGVRATGGQIWARLAVLGALLRQWSGGRGASKFGTFEEPEQGSEQDEAQQEKDDTTAREFLDYVLGITITERIKTKCDLCGSHMFEDRRSNMTELTSGDCFNVAYSAYEASSSASVPLAIFENGTIIGT